MVEIEGPKELINCEDCRYRVEGVEVRIVRWDERGKQSVVNSDVFKEYCSLRFQAVGLSGGILGCSDGKRPCK